ncbi:Facilitated trehalose transporter Tret1-like protein [Dinothrombium tinctorium]|uniref:Facilitated trehalose transporter Tret1-like protein n=1 Tax=Dinothrombium tinctorium TaxID=1965070 RepID=A0A3S3NJD7_9ACAR|nr:Facilitated trehalose transporter Tret1-like protein [Dinothrombium tinctorium]
MVAEASSNVYLAASAALLGAVCAGITLGYSSPALVTMLKSDFDNRSAEIQNKDRIAEESDQSAIGSLFTLGALVGALISGPLSNISGRKSALIIYGIPYATGCIIIYLAKDVAFVLIGRVITGVVVGMISTTAPLYVVEISTPKTRGLLGASFQVCITIGIFLMAFLGIFSTEKFGYFFTWRYLAIVGIIPSLSMSLLMLGMPESPSWLVHKYGRSSAKPEKALTKLRTPKSDIDSELDAMHEIASQSKQSSFLSSEQIKRADFWKPCILGIALMFFQQFSGINAVLFFQTQILKRAQVGNPEVGTAITCFAQIIATVFGAFMMDKLGRRKLLLISGSGHTITLFVLGLYFYLLSKNQAPTPILPIVCLIVYIVSFSVGYGPIPWLMIPEMTPSYGRGIVGAICSAFNWAFAFVTSFTFNYLVKLLGNSLSFWFYTAICALSCVFVLIFLPETKNKTFEEIQRELMGQSSQTASPASVRVEVSSNTAMQEVPKSPEVEQIKPAVSGETKL